MTITKLKITGIKQYTKDKEGNALTGKFGPYVRVVLSTADYPTKDISVFAKTTVDWQVGQEIELDVTENGQYLNGKIPKKEDLAVSGVQELEKRVKKLEETLTTKLAELKADLTLELTGKVATNKDYKEYTKPHPLTDTGEVDEVAF